MIKNSFSKEFGLDIPVIMAPMFLVSNEAMLKSAIDEGILGVFPSLNYRNDSELSALLARLNEHKQKSNKGNYGVNLIVQKTNIMFEKHLKICVDNKVPFYITSLGSPARVIEEAHKYGAKVFCDVTNLTHAQKCYDLGCDGFIAVGQGAGGHAGQNPLQVLIPSLKNTFPDKPIIAAGGIANGSGILSALALGASAVSIGTRFIASTEANVSDDYKNGIVNAEMDDIVLTEKISGTPCTIINTPYAKKIGYKQNWLERLLSKNKQTKKYFKMLVQFRGINKLMKSVKPGSYETLWCAGKSVELIDDVKSIKEIVHQFNVETNSEFEKLKIEMNG
ncbi:MAG: NAD(P)H-dependent flavin oxidoreductase [bacterium]